MKYEEYKTNKPIRTQAGAPVLFLLGFHALCTLAVWIVLVSRA